MRNYGSHLLAVLVLFSVLLAACGSQGQQPVTRATSTQSSAAQVADASPTRTSASDSNTETPVASATTEPARSTSTVGSSPTVVEPSTSTSTTVPVTSASSTVAIPATNTPTTQPTSTSTPTREPTTPPTPTATATKQPTPTVTPVPPTATPKPPTPTPTPKPKPESWYKNATILGMYGRGFGIAPILGRLGTYGGIDDMASDVREWSAKIRPYNGGKRIIPEIHLIYAMAAPCDVQDCLLYLDEGSTDVVNDYIKPAQKRGWLVFLDTQIGSSTPVEQVKRMIEKGYLKYDNVEVAIDPEFHLMPDGSTPGIPIGSVETSQINAVQKLLDDYVKKHHLKHRKILVVHQFGDKTVDDAVPNMIRNKEQLKTYPNVDLTIDMDGFGPPNIKILKYNRFTDSKVYPFMEYRGIKLFPPGPDVPEDHTDQPMLTFKEVFGRAATSGGYQVKNPPDLIIIT